MNAQAPNAMVTATQGALERIASILAKDKKNCALRIAVEGGGCSGFSYTFNLVNDHNDSDFIIEGYEGKILIDDLSLAYMEGAEIDFVDDLMGQSFKVNNPNAIASCGCGTSFSL